MIAINISVLVSPLSFTSGGQLRVPSLWVDGGKCPPGQSGVASPTLRMMGDSSDITGALTSRIQTRQ